eukprot:6200754-Heterocapsa_arctica.AAC.1
MAPARSRPPGARGLPGTSRRRRWPPQPRLEPGRFRPRTEAPCETDKSPRQRGLEQKWLRIL